MSLSMIEANTKSTLHEIIMAEKLDFEAKLQRMAKRKQWLKAHQQLLRTRDAHGLYEQYGYKVCDAMVKRRDQA